MRENRTFGSEGGEGESLSRPLSLLDWSGGCGTRTACSDSPRRNPLTSLRYSVADEGMKSENR